MKRAVILLLAPAILCAQSPMKLNLAEAERLAVGNSPAYSAARSVAAAAGQVPLEYRAAFLPTVTGAVTGVAADAGTRIAAGALNNPVVYNRIGAGIIVSQLVTDFGRTRDLTESSRLEAQAQVEASDAARAGALVAAARAYYSVLRTQAVLKVASETVRARQLIVDQVNALANSKLKSQLDVSFAGVNLADAQLMLAQAENAVKAAQAELANALGLKSETSFELEEEQSPTLPDQVEPLLEQALASRPELKQLRLEATSAERFARAEHALNLPAISATGTAGFVPAGDAAIPGRYGAVGLNVAVPMFNGGLYRARQTEAEFKARAAHDRVTELENTVARDVRVAYLNARTAQERLGLTGQLLAKARLALDLAQGRYDLGLSSIVELSQAQLNLTAAQIGSASARYDYQSQRAVLDYETGALR